MDAEFAKEWRSFAEDMKKPGFSASELSIAERFWRAAQWQAQEHIAELEGIISAMRDVIKWAELRNGVS